MGTQILNIVPASDGDGRKWPKHHYIRNDEYYLDRIAQEWIKDLPGGPQFGITYRLNRMPNGYAGFEKQRGDSKHVDRYIYGHPNGQFRSMAEFYPHFKHLMDVGGSAGCECVKCAGKASKPKLERKSRHFAQSGSNPHSGSNEASLSGENLISPMKPTGQYKKGRYYEDEPVLKSRDVDSEGTPDVYEKLIQRLKDGGEEGSIDEMLRETMSTDWRAGHSQLIDALKSLQDLPRYVPRVGDIVLFVRKLEEDEGIAWDNGARTFRSLHRESTTWQGQPKWEAGVVTQMPQEKTTQQDLVTDAHKQESIVYSGFRIEPLPEPNSDSKPHSRQYKQVPLHAIRPLAYWQECLRGLPEQEWHPTVRHALTVSSSVCPIGRYRFKGRWPNASIFCRGVYIGHELLLLGDTVRLLPKAGEQGSRTVTEIMIITAIRLRFVNLDFDELDIAPAPPALPYQTSLHISGKVYTNSPGRSFNGVSKKPLDPSVLPSGLTLGKHGAWYNYTDPNSPAARVEVPFSRVVGRCYEDAATNTWFTAPKDVKTEMQPPAFKAVNAPKAATDSSDSSTPLLSRGLSGIREGRKYSQEHDTRLTQTGQLWFWADTRIEQLDLHEVNGRFVGAKDQLRSKDQLKRWQKALKGLDGKKGGLEEYHAARKERMEQEKAALQNTGGMMGSAAVDTGMESAPNGDSMEDEDEEGEDEEGGDVMDVDEIVEVPQATQGAVKPSPSVQAQRMEIDLMDSESEGEMANDQRVGELFKNIRPGSGRG